jgi:hypothetical protein
MTKDEALDLALEALEEACEIVGAAWTWRDEKGKPAITAIKEALAQPEPEYLAFMDTPQRTWVGLTNEERADCWETIPELAMRKVEAKLKEKNT